MKKLTIEIWGKGTESFLHKLNNIQFKTLLKGDVEDEEMSHKEITEILKKDSIKDTTDKIYGVYNDDFQIIAKENDQPIWKSNNHRFNTYIDKEEFSDDKYLMVQDYQQGNFFKYELHTKEFNPSLLIAETTEVMDGLFELITDIRYDDKIMKKDFGTTKSKGLYFFLSF